MQFLLLLPTWVAVPLVTLTFNAVAAIGFLTFRKVWPAEPRVAHNDIAGYISAIVGIVYGVLVASIALVALGNYDAAKNTVDAEASLVETAFVDAKALPAPTGPLMREALYGYVDSVTKVEWPEMQRGVAPSAARAPLYGMTQTLARFTPRDTREQIYLQEAVGTVDQLLAARRTRLFAAHPYISPVIWRFLVTSSVFTMVMTFLFGVKNHWAHLIMCCLLASTMGIIFSLIIAVDEPFLRSSGIGRDPFDVALKVMRQLDEFGPWQAAVPGYAINPAND